MEFVGRYVRYRDDIRLAQELAEVGENRRSATVLGGEFLRAFRIDIAHCREHDARDFSKCFRMRVGHATGADDGKTDDLASLGAGLGG